MATEIEAKYRVEHTEALRAKLAPAGAQRVGKVLETNRYFDYPDASLRDGDRAMRIRSEQPLGGASGLEPVGEARVVLTYKGPQQASTVKVREELEFGADDANAAAAVLEALGLEQVVAFEKRRETWTLGACLVVLDELPEIGEFAEVEGPSTEAVESVAAQLDLPGETMEPNSYIALVMRRLERAGGPARRLTFGA